MIGSGCAVCLMILYVCNKVWRYSCCHTATAVLQSAAKYNIHRNSPELDVDTTGLQLTMSWLLCCCILAPLSHVTYSSQDSKIKLNHHHYVIDISAEVNEDYNEISDSSPYDKIKNENIEHQVVVVENHDVIYNETSLITVPVSKVVSILPVDYNESPLNISFKPLGGDIQLDNYTTVTIKDEDITKAVVDKVKVMKNS